MIENYHVNFLWSSYHKAQSKDFLNDCTILPPLIKVGYLQIPILSSRSLKVNVLKPLP